MTSAVRTTTYAWIILSGITIGLAAGHTRSGAAVASVPITAVVLLGFIKGRMVIQYFPEVRTAPRWLKLFTDAWLTVLWAAVLAIYLFEGELNGPSPAG